MKIRIKRVYSFIFEQESEIYFLLNPTTSWVLSRIILRHSGNGSETFSSLIRSEREEKI